MREQEAREPQRPHRLVVERGDDEDEEKGIISEPRTAVVSPDDQQRVVKIR